jgi:hypothetical protein
VPEHVALAVVRLLVMGEHPEGLIDPRGRRARTTEISHLYEIGVEMKHGD